jgi:hypothetical protein
VAMDVGQNGKASYNWKFNSLSFDPRVNDFGNNRIRGVYSFPFLPPDTNRRYLLPEGA